MPGTITWPVTAFAFVQEQQMFQWFELSYDHGETTLG